MNCGFYKDLDTNFEQACEMSDKNFSHAELIEMLKTGNIPQKQIAALKLDGVSEEEVLVLMDNLTGCDGKIREAVAIKIFELLNLSKENIEYFSNPKYAKVFADATIDINSNICRSVIDSVEIMKAREVFMKKYAEYVLEYMEEAFQGLDKIIYKDKKYTVNKQLFKLYWCLEALKHFVHLVDKEKLYNILERSSQEHEYTVREKVAQIISKNKNANFQSINEMLANDENYYVRAALNSTSS